MKKRKISNWNWLNPLTYIVFVFVGLGFIFDEAISFVCQKLAKE